MTAAKKQRFRWLREKRDHGIHNNEQGHELWFGDVCIGHVHQSRFGKPWTWWARNDSDDIGVPLYNSIVHGLVYRTASEAKSACEKYVRDCIVEMRGAP